MHRGDVQVVAEVALNGNTFWADGGVGVSRKAVLRHAKPELRKNHAGTVRFEEFACHFRWSPVGNESMDSTRVDHDRARADREFPMVHQEDNSLGVRGKGAFDFDFQRIGVHWATGIVPSNGTQETT